MRMEETSKQIWNLLIFLDDSQDPEVDWCTGFVSRKEEIANSVRLMYSSLDAPDPGHSCAEFFMMLQETSLLT